MPFAAEIRVSCGEKSKSHVSILAMPFAVYSESVLFFISFVPVPIKWKSGEYPANLIADQMTARESKSITKYECYPICIM